ncbi:MAG: YHS domain-containing protein [Candidatus Omnitrophica bacterium]|nr:YHS domain-containing protein [Candidatus Omnitrophota bacterium]
MFRKLFVGVLSFILIFGAAKLVFAQTQDKAVNIGNKICPVTGEKIDEKTKVTYEYKGKIYNFCCAACPEEFKKDPEKYIKKIEEEKQESQKSEAEMPSENQDHSGMHHSN